MTQAGATAQKPGRAVALDALRGLAVVAMVIYHFAWDLSHFGLIETDVAFHPWWRVFSQSIAASFLAIAGAGLAFASRNGLNWPAFWRRLAVIGGAALAITAATYVATPDRFIFFGILHCIAVSSLLALPFLRIGWGWTAGVALAVIAFAQLGGFPALNHPALVWIGLGSEAPMTNDFEPIFPWLGFMLLGLAAGKFWLGRSRPAQDIAPGLSSEQRPVADIAPGLLARLGRWSLIIYLVHQPLLFGLFEGAGKLGLLAISPEVKGFVQSCAVDCENSGAPYAVCSTACSCVARTLRDRPIWQRVIIGKQFDEDTAELSMVGRRCFEAAAPRSPLTQKP